MKNYRWKPEKAASRKTLGELEENLDSKAEGQGALESILHCPGGTRSSPWHRIGWGGKHQRRIEKRHGKQCSLFSKYCFHKEHRKGDVPSYNCAYCGNPAARSQSHASLASISEKYKKIKRKIMSFTSRALHSAPLIKKMLVRKAKLFQLGLPELAYPGRCKQTYKGTCYTSTEIMFA